MIWTEGAIASDWVDAEAIRASAQRKLVTVRAGGLDPQRIPLPFNAINAALIDDHAAILTAIQRIIALRALRAPAKLPAERQVNVIPNRTNR